MADADESPAQRSARIRREKREAKIRDGGQERLDKITRLSGRTPESMRNSSPVPTPQRNASPALPPTPPSTSATDPEQLRQQEEFIKAMLRSQSSQQQASGQGQEPEDPMMKMLGSMLGGMGDNPDALGGGLPSLNPDDIAKATGLPSFVTNMMMGKQETPATPAEVQEKQMWKLLHLVFAIVAGIYMLFTIHTLTSTFGIEPPAPATARNPFVIFTMGELLLHGSRMVLTVSPVKRGPGFWLQTVKETASDGAIMVFMLGMYNWWHGTA